MSLPFTNGNVELILAPVGTWECDNTKYINFWQARAIVYSLHRESSKVINSCVSNFPHIHYLFMLISPAGPFPNILAIALLWVASWLKAVWGIHSHDKRKVFSTAISESWSYFDFICQIWITVPPPLPTSISCTLNGYIYLLMIVNTTRSTPHTAVSNCRKASPQLNRAHSICNSDWQCPASKSS